MGLSLKLGVVSATVLSTAVMFKVLSPFIMNIAIADLPIIWSSFITWLKPPYLYVVINGIIITIVASSRLQSKPDSSHGSHDSFSTFPTPVEPVKVIHAVELPPVHEHVHEPVVPFHTDVLEIEPVDIAVASYNNESKFVDVPVAEQFIDETLDEEMKIAKEAYEEIKRNKVKKSVISMSAWTPSEINQVGLSFPTEKPPASARFSRRKPDKVTPEGGKALGVAKPKRQDTLESTWKTITEGRSVPLTRHLRKSDTWETHGHSRENRHSPDESMTDNNYHERMTKSDTFDVNRTRKPVKPPPAPSKLSRSGGSGRLRKEPSLGQEELNRRVEAFIKKFNEDMRLQRQESLNQYMEMINRGAH